MRQMRSLAMFAVVAALMAYGLDGGVFAQDATPVTTSAVGNETLVVIDRSTTDTVIDLGEEGDSIGDLLAFGNAVYDEGNETEVGTNQGSCVRTVPGEAWECMFSIILDEEQLTVAGPLYDAGPSELAIIGGTGAYATARGRCGSRQPARPNPASPSRSHRSEEDATAPRGPSAMNHVLLARPVRLPAIILFASGRAGCPKSAEQLRRLRNGHNGISGTVRDAIAL